MCYCIVPYIPDIIFALYEILLGQSNQQERDGHGMCHALRRETVTGFWPENLKETA